MPAGRPKKHLTDDQRRELKTLGAVGLSFRQMAAYFGIGHNTFDRMRDDDPTIDELIEQGAANALAKVGAKLYEGAMEGNTTAQIFIMKAKGGWRENARIEVTGADGGPMQVETSDARDRLKALIARRTAADEPGS